MVRLFLQAALSEDPATRQAAVTAASQGGDPPTGVVAPVPALPAAELQPMVLSAPDPALLLKYKQKHLTRGALFQTYVTVTAQMVSAQTIPTWGVREGGTTPLRPMAFATLTNDEAGLRRLRRTKTRMWVGAGVGLAGFGAMAVAGTLMSAPTPPCNGTSCPDYPPATEPLLMGGAIVGGLSLASIIINGKILDLPFYTWTPDRADALIDGYNDKLRAELGLTPEDTQKIDGL